MAVPPVTLPTALSPVNPPEADPMPVKLGAPCIVPELASEVVTPGPVY